MFPGSDSRALRRRKTRRGVFRRAASGRVRVLREGRSCRCAGVDDALELACHGAGQGVEAQGEFIPALAHHPAGVADVDNLVREAEFKDDVLGFAEGEKPLVAGQQDAAMAPVKDRESLAVHNPDAGIGRAARAGAAVVGVVVGGSGDFHTIRSIKNYRAGDNSALTSEEFFPILVLSTPEMRPWLQLIRLFYKEIQPKCMLISVNNFE